MNFFIVACVLISSVSFLAYSVSYFVSPHMKNEFKRFDLEKIGLFTVILQVLGALGLLMGLLFMPFLLISSCGLAVLMLVALLVRFKSKDSLLISLPALFYMILNAYIFYWAITC